MRIVAQAFFVPGIKIAGFYFFHPYNARLRRLWVVFVFIVSDLPLVRPAHLSKKFHKISRVAFRLATMFLRWCSPVLKILLPAACPGLGIRVSARLRSRCLCLY